jgi:hypothetical protein
VRAAFTDTCWPTIARTASSKPSNVPGTRSPGCACASAPSVAPISRGSAARSNAWRTRPSTAGHDVRERRRDDHAQRVLPHKLAHLDVTRVHGSAAADRDAAHVVGLADRLDALDGAHAQGTRASPRSRKADDRRVERQPIGRLGRAGIASQPRRRHPVAVAEQRVESAHARETARVRDVGDRQVRVGEQALGEQQACVCAYSTGETPNSASNTRRRCRSETPTRAASRSIPPSSITPDSIRSTAPCASREPASIAAWPGRELGPATQARPETARLGGRGAREERQFLAPRHPHVAYRTAVDAVVATPT